MTGRTAGHTVVGCQKDFPSWGHRGQMDRGKRRHVLMRPVAGQGGGLVVSLSHGSVSGDWRRGGFGTRLSLFLAPESA